MCVGHDLTGAYGLEMRTVSAAVNASILPVVERTAALVEEALDGRRPRRAAARAPRRRRRDERRRLPPPAVASPSAPGRRRASRRRCTSSRLADAIVVECGGTSSNVSIVKRGRPVRALAPGDGPPDLRPRGRQLGRRRRRRQHGAPASAARSPRRARAAPTSPACPTPASPSRRSSRAPSSSSSLRATAIRSAYALRPRAGGRLYALTATCAANALGLVADGRLLVRRPRGGAGRVRAARRAAEDDAASAPRRSCSTVRSRRSSRRSRDAARQHELGPDVPLVALGGAGEALVPLVAERLKRAVIRPEHPEVLSSIGAALSLVRAEVTRNATSDGAAVELAREAELACVASGAAPATVTVETAFDARDDVLRAVATGAVALEAGAADREPAGDEARLQAAADALGLEPEALQLVAETGFYRVYSENGSGRVAAVDGLGAVALAEDARRVVAATGDGARRAAPARGARRPRATSASPRSCRASRSSAAPASSTSPTRDVPRTSPPPAARSLEGDTRHRRRRRRALDVPLPGSARGAPPALARCAGAVLLVVGCRRRSSSWSTRAATPSPRRASRRSQDDVEPALAALELMPIHYESPNPTTHAAAADQLGVARETSRRRGRAPRARPGRDATGCCRARGSRRASSARPGRARQRRAGDGEAAAQSARKSCG